MTETIPLDDAAQTLIDGRARDATLTVHCHCEVYYDGRARSDLHGGDRLVVIKPDGTLLVHGPKKQKPRNWMTPGATIEISESGSSLVIEGRTTDPVEEVTVTVSDVYDVSAVRLVDGREKDLSGTERDLQNRLAENPELIEEGFRVDETEYETSEGPVDIRGYDSDGVLCLVELKRRQIDPDAVHQLTRYMEAELGEDWRDSDVRGILVAPEISKQAGEMASRFGFQFVAEDPRKQVSSDTTKLDQFYE